VLLALRLGAARPVASLLWASLLGLSLAMLAPVGLACGRSARYTLTSLKWLGATCASLASPTWLGLTPRATRARRGDTPRYTLGGVGSALRAPRVPSAYVASPSAQPYGLGRVVRPSLGWLRLRLRFRLGLTHKLRSAAGPLATRSLVRHCRCSHHKSTITGLRRPCRGRSVSPLHHDRRARRGAVASGGPPGGSVSPLHHEPGAPGRAALGILQLRTKMVGIERGCATLPAAIFGFVSSEDHPRSLALGRSLALVG